MDYNITNMTENVVIKNGSTNISFGIFTQESCELTLDYLNDQETARRIFPLIYLGLLVLLGVPGNIIVIYIYVGKFQRKATHRTFVVALAITDLMVCCVTIPFEIFQMTREYTFYDKWTCKCGRTVNAILTTASVLILVALSVNRYLRICHPLRIQLTYHQALKVIACIIFISVLVSMPVAMFTGLKEHDLQNNITGLDCSNSPDYENTSYPTIYGIGVLVFYSSCMVLLFIFCILTGRKIFQHMKFRDQFTVTTMLAKSTISKTLMRSRKRLLPKSANDAESTVTIANTKIDKRYSCESRCDVKNTDSPVNISRTALAVCISFIIVFLPNVVINLMASLTKGNIMPPSQLSSILLPTLSRTHFINNVVNFIIYVCMDSSFRKQCIAFRVKIA